MIAQLRGILLQKSPTEILIDVQGVGYLLSIPLSTYAHLGAANTTVTVLTYLHVREDILQLYGFATVQERDFFKLLISVSGIGPKMAQGILSGIAVPDLRSHILLGNLAALTTIPGVGKKLAERLVVELRDKLARVDGGSGPVPPASGSDAQTTAEALMALTSLGFSRPIAENALRAAMREANGATLSIEDLIKASLRHAAK
jgi:Holliday junction DNA helicase RuvA